MAQFGRVQRLDSDGGFELLWGKDAVVDGGVGDTGVGGEVCTVAADCRLGTDPDVGEGEFDNPTGVAVNQVVGHPQSGHVYVRDTGNMRVQEFDADGGFVRAWGWGVATGAEAFEVCTSGCQQGLPGGGNGQLGATGSVASIAVDPASGNVYVADPANQRVQEFEGDGDFVSAFGSAFADETADPGEFGFDQPAQIAVDSSGVVYASDSHDSGRVQRYDTTSDAFLAPIDAPPLTSGFTQALEVDPSTDNLLVLRAPDSGAEAVVEELDTATLTLVDTHGIGDGLGAPDPSGNSSSVFGLGVDGTRGKLYVPAFFWRSPGGSTSVEPFDGLFALDSDGDAAPDPVAGAPLTVDDDSAQLSGTVDPNGPSYYRFEYSKNGVDWQLVDDNGRNNAELFAERQLIGSAPQPVSAMLEGLESNTVYRVRIVATKLTGVSTKVTIVSAETTFVTDAVAPTATTSAVHSYTDSSAWLSGRINPKGSATSYRFEWGEGTDYPHQAPASDTSAGSGAVEKGVLEEIQGLEPDTVYFYRLVAESAEGVTVGADRTFKTRPASGGLAQRGYEQVTPVLKYTDASPPTTGLEILGSVATGRALASVAADGDVASFKVIDALPDAEHGAASVGALTQEYRAVREGDGWSSGLLLGRPLGKIDGSNPLVLAGSPDLSKYVVSANQPLVEGAHGRSLYLRAPLADLYAEIAGVDGDLVQPPSYQGASTSLDHVFYAMPDGGLFEWVDGMSRAVAVDPSGVEFETPAMIGSQSLKRLAVSSDGEHAFFSVPLSVPGTQIYRRSGGLTTVLASPSKRSTPDPEGVKAKVFQSGSADGDRVFFTSSELLTDDANTGPSRAGRDLYRYEVSTDTLIDVSAGSTDPDGAEVVGVLGASEDADRIYYVARGRVVSGGAAGEPNVYMWQDDGSTDGQTRLIATLDELDVSGAGPYNLSLSIDDRPVRVTPDGRALVFHSTASLTGYRNQGFSEVFIYEADANGGEGQLSCVSCRPNGTPAHDDSAVPRSNVAVGGDPARALSEDGRRVFFNSGDALVSQDSDGEHDVYEWEAGRIRLLSVGNAAAPSDFVGASESGDDVFFATRDRLVGQDRDGLLDVYDARVGGGFASQNPVDVPCVGEACRPAPAQVPPAPGPASGGGGDYVRPFEVARITAGQRRLLARRGRIALRIRVDRPGRVLVRALSGRRLVGSASKTATRAEAVTVRLALKRSARRTLARRGRLRLALEVRFGGESETATVSLRRVK